jgi:protein-L-isoaspartate(D-aspartate) O-methyltransferase
MLSPKIVGRILQALDLAATDSVLEIGTGSGFLTAALAMQAARVRSIDRHADFISAARQQIAALGLGSVELQAGDALTPAALGSGSYDAIVMTASLPIYDDRFQQRLAVGGRLFVVVGSAPIMDARLVRRVSPTEFTQQSLFETVIAPLVGAAVPSAFRF